MLALAAALVAACSEPVPPQPEDQPAPPPPPKAEDRVVHVYNWSDYVAEDTIRRFEEASGIKVVYDVYESNEMLEAKLLAGGSGFDVVFPSARPFAQRHIKSDIYAPLDKAKLAGWANLDPKILEGLRDVDPGNAHLVPYMWGTTGIGYNVAKLKERLGADHPLDGWSLLFDPATVAKLQDCGVSILDDEQEAFGAALIFSGRNPNEVKGDEIGIVQDLFAKIHPSVRYFNSSKYIDDLANGEICIAMGYNGDVLQARDRAAEAGAGVEIAYVIPKEGALRWMDSAAIPADAPHPGNAHAFIDFILRPDVIAPISNFVAYANANARSVELLDAEVRDDPGIYPPADVMAKLVDPATLPEEVSRERVRAWTTIKSGQ
jgi:putrescine transport system substrate-binding protein